MPIMPTRAVNVLFDAWFDDQTGVWMASGDRISAAAGSRGALLKRLRTIVPGILEERRGSPVHDLWIVINWRDAQSLGATELGIA